MPVPRTFSRVIAEDDPDFLDLIKRADVWYNQNADQYIQQMDETTFAHWVLKREFDQ